MEISNLAEDGLSQMEREIFMQFRKNIADELRPEDTDTRLLKWLRARNFNLSKSETLYRQYIMARAVHNVDNFEEAWTHPEVYMKYEFANFLGFAKDGTPIRYIDFGRGDLLGFLSSADLYDLAKYCAYEIEIDDKKCREQSLKLGKEIHQVTYVCNMEDFSIRKMLYPCVIEMAIDMIQLLQEYHPEIWRHVIIINAPPYFYTFFNLIKPIIRLNLLKNIIVVSKGHSPEVLLKYIDAEVLPVFLGGKRVDSKGDPMCSEFMKFGQTIPEKYYLCNRPRALLQATDKGAEEVTIAARGSYNYSVVVREPGSLLRVELRTEHGSLLYVTFFRELVDPENPDIPSPYEHLDPNKEKHNVMVCSPGLRGQTQMCPINNFFFAPKPGIYIYKFDNSHNWLTSRKLIYRIRVIAPEVVRNCTDYKTL